MVRVDAYIAYWRPRLKSRFKVSRFESTMKADPALCHTVRPDRPNELCTFLPGRFNNGRGLPSPRTQSGSIVVGRWVKSIAGVDHIDTSTQARDDD